MQRRMRALVWTLLRRDRVHCPDGDVRVPATGRRVEDRVALAGGGGTMARRGECGLRRESGCQPVADAYAVVPGERQRRCVSAVSAAPEVLVAPAIRRPPRRQRLEGLAPEAAEHRPAVRAPAAVVPRILRPMPESAGFRQPRMNCTPARGRGG